jgi:G:T-mismatch repair DNA endonuclease (very short patch repair protein)
LSSIPSTRTDFWAEKFRANCVRDRKNTRSLIRDGWRVAVVWQCHLRNVDQVSDAAREISLWLEAGKMSQGMAPLLQLPPTRRGKARHGNRPLPPKKKLFT